MSVLPVQGKIPFGTKSETLAALRAIVQNAQILPLYILRVADWGAQRESILLEISNLPFFDQPLIIRSSAQNEDRKTTSLAGKYVSVLSVEGLPAVEKAIERVIASYEGAQAQDQVFLQPMMAHVDISGVLFTKDPNTKSDYLVINYTRDGKTDTITSGRKGEATTHYHVKGTTSEDPYIEKLQRLAEELEKILPSDALDVEFCFSSSGELFLFQVRPLALAPSSPLDLHTCLTKMTDHIQHVNAPHPFLYGDRTLFGILPDLNPAETIGKCPRPLALSLFRYLMSDDIWALQRAKFGYKNVVGIHAVHSFAGMPYVDVRAIANSFTPACLAPEIAHRLVNFYIDTLTRSPELQDKVEFEILFSCYSLDTEKRLTSLLDHGFSQKDVASIRTSLQRTTRHILIGGDFLQEGYQALALLEQRRASILASSLGDLEKLHLLLRDGANLGMSSLISLGRLGYVATQWLHSLVFAGIFSPEDRDAFLAQIKSMGSEMSDDFSCLSRVDFLEKYGHLRPGTYDIRYARYDETPDDYFEWSHQPSSSPPHHARTFTPTSAQIDAMNEALRPFSPDITALQLLSFIVDGIKAREWSKFVATKNVSEALRLIETIGAMEGFSKEDLSFLDVRDLLDGYSRTDSGGGALKASIDKGRQQVDQMMRLVLPSLICAAQDIWSFTLPPSQPNFITLGTACGPVGGPDRSQDLKGKIIVMENADPGFDWLFSHHIAGFITAYGGANSHMAIRAHELGVPAIVGAGDVRFTLWSHASKLRIDCANQYVEIL